MRSLLWDTCTAIWILDQAPLAKPALDLLAEAHREGIGLKLILNGIELLQKSFGKRKFTIDGRLVGDSAKL